ncbi:MAG TPA: hypothetical protein VGO16_01530 [Pseudonocardiaceae bacterium]|nr:hypothetical protein [Pseudonocardiaceae bacterium]
MIRHSVCIVVACRAGLNDTAVLLADSVEQRGADHRGDLEGRDARDGTGRPSP